jgi:hypothetical protein
MLVCPWKRYTRALAVLKLNLNFCFEKAEWIRKKFLFVLVFGLAVQVSKEPNFGNVYNLFLKYSMFQNTRLEFLNQVVGTPGSLCVFLRVSSFWLDSEYFIFLTRVIMFCQEYTPTKTRVHSFCQEYTPTKNRVLYNTESYPGASGSHL